MSGEASVPDWGSLEERIDAKVKSLESLVNDHTKRILLENEKSENESSLELERYRRTADDTTPKASVIPKSIQLKRDQIKLLESMHDPSAKSAAVELPPPPEAVPLDVDVDALEESKLPIADTARQILFAVDRAVGAMSADVQRTGHEHVKMVIDTARRFEATRAAYVQAIQGLRHALAGAAPSSKPSIETLVDIKDNLDSSVQAKKTIELGKELGTAVAVDDESYEVQSQPDSVEELKPQARTGSRLVVPESARKVKPATPRTPLSVASTPRSGGSASKISTHSKPPTGYRTTK